MMRSKKILGLALGLGLGLGLMLTASLAACAQEAAPAPEPEATSPTSGAALGVVIGLEQEASEITMLVDGNSETFAITDDLAQQVQEGWDEYSHWGMYEATLENEEVVALEYGEGVNDIIGVFADYESDKTLADVLSFAENEVTIANVGNLLDSDDPDALPGFDSTNPELTPADGESFEVAADPVIYVEGADGIFTVGSTELITGSEYDYVEFYDIDGDWVYDQVIVWLI